MGANGFSNMVYTTQGLNLLAKVETGTPLNFTRIAVGDGILNGQNEELLTALIEQKMSLNISSLVVSGSGAATVCAALSNASLTTGFYWREIGLFATDPQVGEILFGYDNSTGHEIFVPAASTSSFTAPVNIQVSLSNAASVTATIDPSLVYVTQSQVGQPSGVASLDATGNVPASQLKNAPAPANATATTSGLVEVAAAPASGNPIASSQVASAKEVEITGTTAQTIAAYTPIANGNFEARASFRVVTGTTNVTITVSYNSAGGAQTYTALNAQVCVVGEYSIVPFAFNAVANQPITIQVTASVANQVYASGGITGV